MVFRSLVLAASLVLAGCGMFGGKKREAYQGSREGRPLEVPPDLDAPETSRSLVIPASGDAPAGADYTAPPDASPSGSGARIEPGREASL
ncbi:MAG TPA: hypothetical protein VND91_03350, partial [Candidatus Saccharimonadia bacterium]|nr:hypothetical protein [Candidatus Saccharimonadia bacterium]